MTQPFRLQTGGRIDRARPLKFSFNGKEMSGFAGDTVASALLANGAGTVARSFKYRRPRGIFSAGAEEPNAIFTVGAGGFRTPHVRATLAELADGMEVRAQSGWPSVNFDAGALLSHAGRMLPAGFYYKTFMWPPKMWTAVYEKIIRRAASGARAPDRADEDSYAHRYAHCDVLVAGGGPAGLSAALAAAASGARVILADMNPEFGGDLLAAGDEEIDGIAAARWLEKTTQTLAGMDNVVLLPRTTVQGYYDYNMLTAAEELPKNYAAAGLRRRLWKIRAAQVVVAAGALERPLVFADNDRPGVMLAGAVRTYINRYGVLPGRKILFFTNNDGAYRGALAARAAGAVRVEIADIRGGVNGYWQTRARDEGIAVHAGYGICGALLTGADLSVRLSKLSPGADFLSGGEIASSYDIVAVSGGWTPTAHLFSQGRGALAWNDRLGAFAPDSASPLNPCRACGAAAGALPLAECLRGGGEAGAAAARACGFSKAAANPAAAAAEAAETPPLFIPFVPTRHPPGCGPGKHFVDLMNDVTVGDILLAAREGYDSVEHMKRYTAAGFGADQGKTGNINALTVLAHARGVAAKDIGHTTFRPQYTPLPFGAVAGAELGELFAPVRRTPMHEWHESQNAVWEDVGEWRRPCYFPRGGETMAAAVARECRAARESVAMMDATTLGKIDIQGPDAAEFLDLIYTNAAGALKNGRCRYGLMLREDGMVYDDGVMMRLSDNHFHITTSTGHAAGVMNWLEEWLQTEWPHLRVFCTSVTEQWAVIALAGPKAREVLAPLTGIPLAAADFPFMSWREGEVAGVPARVCRISFSGELAFEINVPSRYGRHVWERIFRAGGAHGITAYGTETMRVLRAEKGYIIAGQDSDGATSPIDMGLSWMLSKKKKDYIGRRSLARPAIARSGRPQFVGLLAEDPQALIPEGAYLAAVADTRPPFVAEGYVTSSYMSANLSRSIALAMVKDGFSRHGEIVHAALLDGRRIAAKITAPIFWDKEEKRRNG
ncbi:MAG: sarcosine oxidase subunit alpha family protein [Betaproteobacteria bacterium]|nr:sarcosine oxidase subunit alpha family protein [Betaproteobacteria bacterium]